MSPEEVILESPIEEKIAWAEHCHGEKRRQLLADNRVMELLRKFKEAASASHREMAISGVSCECKDCEEMEGGSCCAAGLENKYDGILLMINLLLDVNIPKQRNDPSGCFFLGPKGCQLLARHVICVNYICKKIIDHINPHRLSILREKEGDELELLFSLHEHIRKILRHQ